MSAILAQEYVARHNAGVLRSDWQPLGELFHAGATLQFEGLEHAPVHGRDAIVQAYAAQPPTDLLVLRGQTEMPHATVVRYAWSAAPGRVAGTLRFCVAEGSIRELTITTAVASFCVLYRFRTHPGRGAELEATWHELTLLIAAHRGSLGSRLHRAGPAEFIAYAQWPSRASWHAPDPLPPPGPAVAARMKACCASIEVLAELEPVDDLLV